MILYRNKSDKYSSHRQICQIVLNQKRFNTTILDLGCDVGFLGQNLKKETKSFIIEGVDINKANLSKAKKFYNKVYNFDVNNPIWPIKKKYEIVVLADTIEHLYNPQKTIDKISSLMKDNGLLVVSIPNSVFLWARLKIALGQFPKEDRGLFDKTHLHFYTLGTFKSFINNFREFSIVSIHKTTFPVQFIFGKQSNSYLIRILYEFSYFLASIIPTLFAYQFIFVLSKRKK